MMNLSIIAELAGDITISEEQRDRILKNCKKYEKADAKVRSTGLFSHAQTVSGKRPEEKVAVHA